MNVNNTNTTAWEEINTAVLDILWYYEAILIPLGMLGNVTSMCVFFRTRLHYTSSSIYLSALALSDNVYLSAYLSNWNKHKKICETWNYLFGNFLTNISTFLSAWFVIVFTIERYVAIKWPHRSKVLITVGRAKMVVIVLTGTAIVYSILLNWMEYSFCDINYDYFNLDNYETHKIHEDYRDLIRKIYSIITPIIAVFLPLPIIIIFNILITHQIYKQNHIRETIIMESNASNGRGHISGNGTPQIKITKMLILVSSVFVCLNVPKCICWFLIRYYNEEPKWLTPWWEISKRLYFTNFTLNFFLYCLSGQNFRRELIYMYARDPILRKWKQLCR